MSNTFFSRNEKYNIIFYIILGIFLIQILLLFNSFLKGFYKYFLIKELNLSERYGKGSWVVITGASSGQGYDFALEFAKRDFNILMIGSKRTIKTEKEINEKYPNVKTSIIYKDFGDAFKSNFFDDIINKFNELENNISILINNVGYRTAWKPYHEMNSDLITRTIATGTIVQSRLTQLIIPIFLEREKKGQKSALVNITAQCIHPNLLFGLTTSNEISVPYLSIYEASNAFGFYQGNSIYKEYKNNFDILNITPGAVITRNTPYLKDTIFSINSNYFVKQIIKMIGNVNGHSCAYWGHSLSNYLINLVPFMKDKILEDVGLKITTDFMKSYSNKVNPYSYSYSYSS